MDNTTQHKGGARPPDQTPDVKTSKGLLGMLSSPTMIWKSRVSWRITTSVFATILLIQTLVLIFTARSYEIEQLEHLRKVAISSILPMMNNIQDQTISPLTKPLIDRLFQTTPVQGIAVYGLDYSIIQREGLQMLLRPKRASEEMDYRSADNKYYEVIFTPSDLGHPYNIVAKIDASEVEPHVVSHIHQTLWILLCMSGLVTSLLMLVLSQWLLEPMMLLRNNLLAAAKNPEKPNILTPKKELHDEIGTAIRIANDLIRQNSNNLKRLRAQAEDKIHKLAYFDNLTGLPNRTYFVEKLEDAIKHKVAEEGGKIAVFSVDLDHFKDINDTMGHEMGDKLLEAVGKRLVKAMPETAVISRASADEFSIMVPMRAEQDDSTEFVDNIFATMVEPISILQERFQIRVSIGVATSPDDGMDARQLMKNADIALNRAKEEGRDTVRYYSQDFDTAIQQRFQLLRDLRIAIDQKQLLLHYHPQFDLKTGQMIGVEALIRWWRPDNSKEGGKFISPAEFIPVAEQSGLIVPIGEYVMRTACETNKKWQEQGLPPFRMAVNISGVQFHRADIVTMVDTILKETKLDARWLELEVTESVFMENMQIAIDTLARLHELGVELAVDDFGTGYSSLSYLRQFPIDRLKVDQSFIRSALSNRDDRMIVRTIISLGHNLGLKVIAEGVETSEHEAMLIEEGCDESQGFKYSKPIPEDKLVEFAINHNRNLAKNSKLSVVDNKQTS